MSGSCVSCYKATCRICGSARLYVQLYHRICCLQLLNARKISQPRDSDNDSLSWMPTHDPYIEEACDTDGEWVADDNLRWRWVPNSRDTQGFLPGAAGVDPALHPDLVSNNIRVIVGRHRSQCRVPVFLVARQLVVNVVVFYSTQDSQPRDSDNDSLSLMPTHDPYIEEACDTDGERVADDNLCWRWVPNSRDTQGFLPGAAGVDPALYPDLVSNSIRVIVGPT